MADVKDTAGSKPNQVPPPEDAALDLEPETEQAFLDVLVSGDEAGVRTLMAELHHADAADLLERLNADERARVVEILRDDFEPKILSELDETVRDHVIECLPTCQGADNPARYEPTTYTKYMTWFATQNYAHFRDASDAMGGEAAE